MLCSYIAVVLLISSLSCSVGKISLNENLPEMHGSKFYYFGYGSNMLAERIHLQNPTAVRIGVGVLKGYRLDFYKYTERWDGAPATIVPSTNPNDSVHGALWDIDIANLRDLDNQEGVHLGIYTAVNVPIRDVNSNVTDSDSDSTKEARAYMLVDQPEVDFRIYSKDDVPLDQQPSKTYLQCLVKGAQQTGIPDSYVNWLKSIQHNGRSSVEFENILNLGNVELPN